MSEDADRTAGAAHAVRKVTRVPDTHRVFTDSAATAARVHRIGADLLELLLDLGLPHRGAGSDRRFDRMDLENISLALRLPGPRWTAMRWWPRSLPEPGQSGPVRYRLTLRLTCPSPTRPHDCMFELHPAALAADELTDIRRTPDGYAATLTTTTIDHVFGPPFAAVIDRIRPVEFHLIPDVLAGDVGFALDTGLADCRLGTALTVHIGRELGVAVRPAVGLLLTRPYPGWHSWVEVDTGTRGWVSADPFLLSNLIRWGVLDAGQWPANRSPQGVLCRWSHAEAPLVTHRGVAAWPEFGVSRLDPDG